MLPPVLKKLKRAVSVLAVAALFFFSIRIGYAAVDRVFPCMPLEKSLKYAFNSGYALVGGGMTTMPTVVMQFFIHPDGRFLISAIDKDLNSCFILRGSNWQDAVSFRG